jgi:hypothetical protein
LQKADRWRSALERKRKLADGDRWDGFDSDFSILTHLDAPNPSSDEPAVWGDSAPK